MAERIPVKTPTSQYDITVESGMLRQLAQRATEEGLVGSVVIGTDTTVSDLYARSVSAQLDSVPVLQMGTGEQHKNLNTVRRFYDQLVQHGADRQTTLVALGGGVVGDTVGFVAATYMRGIRLVQMPTTLLAMVDSSVGGKVGVDLPQGKNLVGAFKQPDRVLIDPDVLGTLSPEQWRAGMAEVIKHGLLADPKLLDPALHAPQRAEELVRRAVQVKVDVVQRDPYEKGERAHLNLGHTFAHAIEQVTEYAWLHGYAVGFGLLAAAKLSHHLGLCDTTLVEQVDTILAEIGLPRSLNGLQPAALYAAMKTDKKWRSGVSRFVLLKGMNQPVIVDGVSEADVISVLQQLA